MTKEIINKMGNVLVKKVDYRDLDYGLFDKSIKDEIYLRIVFRNKFDMQLFEVPGEVLD